MSNFQLQLALPLGSTLWVFFTSGMVAANSAADGDGGCASGPCCCCWCCSPAARRCRPTAGHLQSRYARCAMRLCQPPAGDFALLQIPAVLSQLPESSLDTPSQARSRQPRTSRAALGRAILLSSSRACSTCAASVEATLPHAPGQGWGGMGCSSGVRFRPANRGERCMGGSRRITLSTCTK